MIRALPRLATRLLAILLFGFAPGASAHEGHHHDEAEAPVPHAVLDSAQVEIVAQREGGDIVLYLDDYATNAPLDGMQVSVRSGDLTLQAAGGEGMYRFPADLLPGSGAQPLDLAIRGGGIDAHLQLELPAASDPAPSHPSAVPVTFSRLGGAALITLLLLAAWLLRRRGMHAAREAGAA